MQTTRYKRFALLSALVAAFVVPVAAAEAHTLGKYRAANKASVALYNHASAGEQYFEVLTSVDRISASDCVRMSRHYTWCIGSFEYETLPEWEYDDGSTIMFCHAEVDVRMSRYNYRLRTRTYGEECF